MIDNKIIWTQFEMLNYKGNVYTLSLCEIKREIRPRLLYHIKKEGKALFGFGVDYSEDDKILSLKEILEVRLPLLS